MEIRQMQHTAHMRSCAGPYRLFHRARYREAKGTGDVRRAANRRITLECVVRGLLADGDRERWPALPWGRFHVSRVRGTGTRLSCNKARSPRSREATQVKYRRGGELLQSPPCETVATPLRKLSYSRLRNTEYQGEICFHPRRARFL